MSNKPVLSDEKRNTIFESMCRSIYRTHVMELDPDSKPFIQQLERLVKTDAPVKQKANFAYKYMRKMAKKYSTKKHQAVAKQGVIVGGAGMYAGLVQARLVASHFGRFLWPDEKTPAGKDISQFKKEFARKRLKNKYTKLISVDKANGLKAGL